MSKTEDIKQEINRLQEQIDYLRTQQGKLKCILEELEPPEYIDHCCVCGTSSKEKKINIHSAINMPVSLSYCEDCDKKGYITEDELIRYLAIPSHKEHVIKNIDFIMKNAGVLAKTMLKRTRNGLK